LTARECGRRVVSEAGSGEVAVVFGREQSGLTNDELKLCNALVQIPTSPDFSSLNLAMAVQVIAYEIQVAAGGEARLKSPRENPLATADEIENLFDHLERVLIGSGFLNPDNPRHLMLRLRRLCARAEPDSNEVAILRGILSALVPGSGRPSPRQNEDIGAE
ncbi:MAG: TrmH family RNA methyltransferase, partial [Gammaproteobacteria bacterium]